MKHLFQLPLLLLAFLLPATALAHDFEVDGIYYNAIGSQATVTNRGTASSLNNNDYPGDVNIPPTVTYNGKTYSVTAISHSAFYGCSSMTSITIPNSISSIGYYQTFYGCTGLSSIKVANDNPYYDSRNNCNAIIETASNKLIAGCKNTVIPNTVTAIGSYAFSRGGLTSITIPNSVSSIDNYAFTGCTGLTDIKVVNDNPYYDSRNNCNAIIETASNKLIAGCKNTVIPNTVTSIGNFAFYQCSSLTSIDIPNSVTSIGHSAFNGCSSLTSVTIPNSVTTIGGSAFFGTGWYNNQPDGLVYAGLVAYTYKGTMPNGTSITLRDGTLGIAAGAFSNCKGLISITMPNSVTNIGASAFYGCNSLTSVSIPDSVSVSIIGEDTFYGCSSLTSITIPNNVSLIDKNAFFACTGLTSVTLGNSLTTIGEKAFSFCTSLLSVEIPNTLTTIGESAFYYCYSLTSVTIPNSVTYIDMDAFYGCGLTSVTIPNSVTYLGYEAFLECSSLTNVTIGNSISDIYDNTFYGCNALETVKCIGTVPPVMKRTNCFSTAAYNNATLLVPSSSIEAYQATDYWHMFNHIQGYNSTTTGDVDGDGLVNISDVTVLIDLLLGGTTPPSSADVDGDGSVNISDVTTLIDMLLADIR